MPPKHPNKEDITADEYRTAAKVCDAEKAESWAAEFRTAAARIAAKSVSEEVEALALIQHEELCTHREFMGWTRYKPWDKMPEDTRLERYVGIRAVLAHLTTTGRLVPEGGMPLTAEQVEDVRGLVNDKRVAYTGFVNRLRALFPATEPAEEPLTREQAIAKWKAMGVHTSDCALHNEPASPAGPCNCHMSENDETWQTLATVPVTVPKVVDTKGREFWRGAHGWKPYYFEDGTDHHTFAPFKPAPAVPAEEETKAEGPSKFRKGDVEIQAMRVTPSNSIDVVNWVNGRPDAWREGYDGNAYPDMGGIEIPTSEGVKYVAWGNWVIKSVVGEFSLCVHSIFVNTFEPVPASSPVVPAPTETGPWETPTAIPVGVPFRDKEGSEFVKLADGTFGYLKVTRETRKTLAEFAPFVAVEEGDA